MSNIIPKLDQQMFGEKYPKNYSVFISKSINLTAAICKYFISLF